MKLFHFGCAVLSIAFAILTCREPVVAGSPESPYGLNIYLPQTDFQFSMLEQSADVGIDWVRIDFSWFDVEASQGNINWSLFDNLVAHTQQSGQHVFASLGGPPTWALKHPDTQADEPGHGVIDNPQLWHDFVDQAVQRYAGVIDHWGIWNEPDLINFWYGTRQQFIDEMLIPTVDVIHFANPNPNAKVVEPGLSMLAGNKPT